MNFTSQIRYNPKTGRDERYYRLKESYRNALGRSCTRILLNVGFVARPAAMSGRCFSASTMSFILAIVLFL